MSKTNSSSVQKWEYAKIYCGEFVIGFDENKNQIDNFHILKERKKAANPFQLDPAIPLPSNEKVIWQLAWSNKNEHWANISSVLNELGDEGWELVSVTPPWNSVAIAPNAVGITGPYMEPYFHTNRHYFHLLLKRRKN